MSSPDDAGALTAPSFQSVLIVISQTPPENSACSVVSNGGPGNAVETIKDNIKKSVIPDLIAWPEPAEGGIHVDFVFDPPTP